MTDAINWPNQSFVKITQIKSTNSKLHLISFLLHNLSQTFIVFPFSVCRKTSSSLAANRVIRQFFGRPSFVNVKQEISFEKNVIIQSPGTILYDLVIYIYIFCFMYYL